MNNTLTDETMEEAGPLPRRVNKPLRVPAGVRDFIDVKKKSISDEVKEFTKQVLWEAPPRQTKSLEKVTLPV